MRTPLRLLSNGMILFATLGLTGMAHAEISFGAFGSSSSEHSLVTSSGHPESTKISRSSIKVRDLEDSFRQQKEDQRKLAEMQSKLDAQERTLKDLRGSSSSRSLEELERKVDKLAQLERKLDDQARTIDSLKRELEQLSRKVN